MELLGPSTESLRRDIAELQESGVDDFFGNHFEYLIDQLFLVANGSPEARLLRRQIDDITRLNVLYQNEFQRPFTREANAVISERFHVIFSLLESGNDLLDIREEIEGLIDRELDRLADTINPFSERTPRDIVERNVDFYSSLEHRGGIYFEYLLESDSVEMFLQLFTVAYINRVGGQAASVDGVLQCTHDDIREILREVYQRISQEELEQLAYVLRIQTLEGEINISFHDILIPEQENINPHMDTAPVEPIEQDVPIEQDLPYRYVIEQFHEGILSRERAWEILEGEDGFLPDKNDGFSLSRAINTFGFSQGLQRDINTIFGRELSHEESLNLNNMIRYFLYVESSGGYNVANYEGVSTARGYFQYLTGDGGHVRQVYRNNAWHTEGRWSNDDTEREGEVRRFWGNNSYETGLLKIPESIRSLRPIFNQELEKRGSPLNEDGTLNQNPMSLSSEEQIILFLSDLQARPGVTSDMINRMLSGDIQAVEALYTAHHTDPDRATHLRMLLAKREVYGIEIEVFSRRGDSIEGIILPGVNMTEFFMELITELNPNTSLSSLEVMRNLDALGTIRFQAGGIISISRSSEDGIAYDLEYNGDSYMRVYNSGEFEYLM